MRLSAMKFFAVYLIIATILAVAQVRAQNSNKCEADHDCYSNEYCYEKSSLCTKCVDCATYRREASTITKCVKIASECGACLGGYKEEYLADYNKRPLCQIVHTVGPSNIGPSPESRYSAAMYTAAVFGSILVLCIACATIYFCKKKYRLFAEHMKGFARRPVDIEESHTPQPPPYTERVERDLLMPTAPPVLDPGDPEPSGSFYINVDEPQVAEYRQKAVPFMKPQAPYYQSTEAEDSDLENEDVSAIDLRSPASIDLQDEDTMPSNWSPDNVAEATTASGESDQASPTEGECCRSQSEAESTARGTTLTFTGRILPRTAENLEPDSRPKRPRLDSDACDSQESYAAEAPHVAPNMVTVINNVSINIVHSTER